MVIKKFCLKSEKRENIRGGKGVAKYFEYIREKEWSKVKFISLIELEPFSSVGEHKHIDEEEFYFIVDGKGYGILNGKKFELEKGDAFLCKKNETHGIEAGENELSFLAVLL